MEMVAVAVAFVPTESTTVAVTERLETDAAGIPVIRPVAVFRLRPAGRGLIENVYGAKPPVAISELLYHCPA